MQANRGSLGFVKAQQYLAIIGSVVYPSIMEDESVVGSSCIFDCIAFYFL